MEEQVETGRSDLPWLAIANKSMIEKIDLADQAINNEEAMQLAKVIEGHPYVKLVKLQNNDFTDRAALALAKACFTCPKLRFLYLQGNEISPACDKDIVAEIRKLGYEFTSMVSTHACDGGQDYGRWSLPGQLEELKVFTRGGHPLRPVT